MLPIRIVSSFADFCARIGFSLAMREAKLTLRQLKEAFPSKPMREIRKIAEGTFANIARNYMEYLLNDRISKNNIDRWVRPHGLERIDDVFSRGKGIIVLTAHLGNWELVGAYMRIKGYRGATIVKELYFYKYEEYLKKLRAVHDVGTIYRDESPKKMLRMLKDNLVLGMLADQDIGSVEGVFVDFFGKPAYTPTAPVKIALVSGAPIVPCFMVRNGLSYDYFVDEPIYVEGTRKDKEEVIKYYTQRWSSVLESYIRKYPDQWVWMHKRWKTKPEDKNQGSESNDRRQTAIR